MGKHLNTFAYIIPIIVVGMVRHKHKRGIHYRKGKNALYTLEEKKEFRERYGKRGDRVFGATLHKVKAEQNAKRKHR